MNLTIVRNHRRPGTIDYQEKAKDYVIDDGLRYQVFNGNILEVYNKKNLIAMWTGVASFYPANWEQGGEVASEEN